MRLRLKMFPTVLPTRGYNVRSLGHIPRGSATAHSSYFTPSLRKTQKVRLLHEPLAFPGAQPHRKALGELARGCRGRSRGRSQLLSGSAQGLPEPGPPLQTPLLFNAYSPPTQDQSSGAGCC